MGARAVSLFLRTAPYKNFYAIGMDLRLGPQQAARTADLIPVI
jgi:hypothetical protein